MILALGLIIPFLGTCLGAATIFIIKKELNKSFKKLLLGFAIGVMLSASIWSLLIPALEMTESSIKWLPVSIGFVAGIMFLLLLDYLIPHLHAESDKPEGVKSNFKKSTMLILSVTLHNIPEGMAVGVILAGLVSGNALITTAGALSLSIGIAVQNFPEGAIVSTPLLENGMSKKKGFLFGCLSGIVEPIFGLLTVLLTQLVVPLLPYLLSFAAGAMIYVVVDELIPESNENYHSNLPIIGLTIGFVLMMILDIALG